MIAPPTVTKVLGLLAALTLLGSAIAGVAGAGTTVVALGLAAALVGGGLALAGWGRAEMEHEVDREERRQKGPRIHRRRMIIGMGAAIATALAAVVAVPAFMRSGAATERLRTTAWSPGARLVTPDGEPIAITDIRSGTLLTAFPEGSTESISAQTLVVGVAPEQVPGTPLGDGGAGVLAYSKLCTHMACPVGLYQAQTGTVVCPCHQAVFDLIHDGRVLRGPAGRPLPRLPVDVDPDGFLVARGDFSGAVGTGFWGRP